MKTDALFYRLFRIAPSLFQLVRLNIKGRYSFKSIAIKADIISLKLPENKLNIVLELMLFRTEYKGDT
ncbi:MAG: hypothetical protein GY795_34535 [Desulfobacterales bacterium]|nr:hypothetical protein [Desulfobacterales bacterium]